MTKNEIKKKIGSISLSCFYFLLQELWLCLTRRPCLIRRHFTCWRENVEGYRHCSKTHTIYSMVSTKSRLDGKIAVARLPAWMWEAWGPEFNPKPERGEMRFLYKLGQPPKTSISYSSLSVPQSEGEITLKSFIFISYHRSCYLCRLYIQRQPLLLARLSHPLDRKSLERVA